MSIACAAKLVPSQTIFLLCDLQIKFRPVIQEFDLVLATSNKMLKVAKVLEIPVVISEQNSAKLGGTTPALNVAHLGPLHLTTVDKTLFSMVTPEVETILKAKNMKSAVLMGIESHICILQSALDLIDRGYDVHVLADGVSSCNKDEIPLALARMRQAGVQVSSSESAAYQLMSDAGLPAFRSFAQIIKEETAITKSTVETLLGGVKSPL